jgi:alkanesulfonate monooxygenase SsuD/methylene tetrahydromethanopterin reductase-like flavin-dependent oxidoreductase (luciferase family)
VKFAVNAPNYGTFADARLVAELAREAESAGWDGFFLWDHVQAPDNLPLADTWLLLAAIAMTTQRMRIGPMVTPLPRRRPWRLAREAVTLDRLSNGRLILGLGLGDDAMREYSAFGETVDARLHAAMLEEGLDILAGLWRGERFRLDGKHYTVDDVQFLPKPMQQPRIPIWLAGHWPSRRPFRRALQWDGVVPVSREGPLSLQECGAIRDFVSQERTHEGPFDIVVAAWPEDRSRAEEAELARAYADAGATWYQMALSGEAQPSEVRALLEQGPPAD